MSDGMYIYQGHMDDDDRDRIDSATGMHIGGSDHSGGFFRDGPGMAFRDNDPIAAMYGMAPDPYAHSLWYGGGAGYSGGIRRSAERSIHERGGSKYRDIETAALLLLILSN